MAEQMSKSAKKRAAKKARDEAGPPAVPGAQAAAPQAAPKSKPEPKAKAAAPPAAEPKVSAKPKADAKTKPNKKAEPQTAPPVKPKSDLDPLYALEMDDGSGGAWTTSSGLSNKMDKRKQKKIQEEKDRMQREIEDAKAQKAALKGGGSTFAATQMAGMTETQKTIAYAKELASAPLAAKQADGAKTEGADEKKNQSSATIAVPEKKIGHVIGPGGKNLKMITEKTGVNRIDTEGENFTVVGEPEAVKKAEAAIREIVEKGYCSLAYDDFEGTEVMAHPQSFPDLIGKQGAIIQALKKELGVEVSIPAVPKGGPGYKKYPVGVAGSKESVQKAKEALESIIMYYHHPITHPDMDHLELDVPDWGYSFLIGKQGSELKHIENNFSVRLYIPRENSANQNVVVVGLKRDIERTKTYVEKVLKAASEPRGRGAADKAEDHFGGEDPVEPWMEKYMYKRK